MAIQHYYYPVQPRLLTMGKLTSPMLRARTLSVLTERVMWLMTLLM